MPALTDEQKVFLVERLAMYDTPAHVAEDFKQEYGIELARSHIQAYDPERRQGRNLSKKYRTLFAQCRKAFEEERVKEPLMLRMGRVRRLRRLYEKVEGMGNIQMAREILAQIAKEAGDGYSNVRHNTHAAPDGGPVRMQHAHAHLVASLPANYQELSTDELTRVYRDIVAVPGAGTAR